MTYLDELNKYPGGFRTMSEMVGQTNGTLCIALVQIGVLDGDLQHNFCLHKHAAEKAAEAGADLVLFPELSLTGYTLERAQALALDETSPWVARLLELAGSFQLTLIAGAPLNNGVDKPAIGALCCGPSGILSLYRKQYLHPGEERYICPGTQNGLIDIKGYRVALAICADSMNPGHGEAAAAIGADCYLASVLISPQGMAADRARLQQLASTHRMPVLMANHCGLSGGWQGAGASGFWHADGEQQCRAGTEPALVLVTLDRSGKGSCRCIEL